MIVLDSSFLIGFHNERDAHHPAARMLMDEFLAGAWGRGLLLEYVFLEIMTVLVVRRGVSTARQVGRILLDAEELEFVPCSGFFLAVFQTFSTQPGIRLSFADAAIVETARERAEGQVLTFDQEFRRIHGLRIYPDAKGPTPCGA